MGRLGTEVRLQRVKERESRGSRPESEGNIGGGKRGGEEGSEVRVSDCAEHRKCMVGTWRYPSECTTRLAGWTNPEGCAAGQRDLARPVPKNCAACEPACGLCCRRRRGGLAAGAGAVGDGAAWAALAGASGTTMCLGMEA